MIQDMLEKRLNEPLVLTVLAVALLELQDEEAIGAKFSHQTIQLFLRRIFQS